MKVNLKKSVQHYSHKAWCWIWAAFCYSVRKLTRDIFLISFECTGNRLSFVITKGYIKRLHRNVSKNPTVLFIYLLLPSQKNDELSRGIQIEIYLVKNECKSNIVIKLQIRNQNRLVYISRINQIFEFCLHSVQDQ